MKIQGSSGRFPQRQQCSWALRQTRTQGGSTIMTEGKGYNNNNIRLDWGMCNLFPFLECSLKGNMSRGQVISTINVPEVHVNKQPRGNRQWTPCPQTLAKMILTYVKSGGSTRKHSKNINFLSHANKSREGEGCKKGWRKKHLLQIVNWIYT